MNACDAYHECLVICRQEATAHHEIWELTSDRFAFARYGACMDAFDRMRDSALRKLPLQDAKAVQKIFPDEG